MTILAHLGVELAAEYEDTCQNSNTYQSACSMNIQQDLVRGHIQSAKPSGRTPVAST